ncbi:protein EI24 homolog isoform X2 [Magnolia sinica]|uniref:protein EI24 homolog isoform X2 n=1 Tax=Magnolia sinica TaxID=86752 RepID=UPI002658627A|nr:protein EI24 homolog isoform X2 [Magnolia sinica]
MDAPAVYVKQAGLLWLAGFREACCLHRVFFFCSRSRELLKRTGQCFLLNGLIFLGSFVLSSIWYNDIAKLAFSSMGIESSSQSELSNTTNVAHVDRQAGLGRAIIEFGEQVYSVLLLTFFFIEVYAAEFIPYIGKAINFLLLSWMYAYYCFEYKWNLTELGLDKRIDFFESNWAFFAGFGSPCVMAIFFFSQLVSYGVMATLFPLFVLTAVGTQAEQVIDSQRKSWKGRGLGKLRLFNAADTLATRLLHIIYKDRRD